jgi:hypothetical protein
MASFTVEYTQGTTGPGEITFTIDASSATQTASGRLDSVGSRVVTPTFHVAGVAVVVECVRTSSDAMRVTIVFNPGQGTYGGFSGTERVIENVPLSFT